MVSCSFFCTWPEARVRMPSPATAISAPTDIECSVGCASQKYTATKEKPTATLFGSANAIDTRKVLVNGAAATWSAWEARWTNAVALRPGINRVVVQSLDANEVEFARATVDIW